MTLVTAAALIIARQHHPIMKRVSRRHLLLLGVAD